MIVPPVLSILLQIRAISGVVVQEKDNPDTIPLFHSGANERRRCSVDETTWVLAKLFIKGQKALGEGGILNEG